MIKNRNLMVIIFTCLCTLFLNSCQTRPYMSFKEFDTVEVGESIVSLQRRIGKPYKIEEQPDGKMAYVYIERIPLQDSHSLHRQYILTIADGKVEHKEYKEEESSYIHFHSQ